MPEWCKYPGSGHKTLPPFWICRFSHCWCKLARSYREVDCQRRYRYWISGQVKPIKAVFIVLNCGQLWYIFLLFRKIKNVEDFWLVMKENPWGGFPPLTNRKSPSTNRKSPTASRKSPSANRKSPPTDRKSPPTDRKSPLRRLKQWPVKIYHKL